MSVPPSQNNQVYEDWAPYLATAGALALAFQIVHCALGNKISALFNKTVENNLAQPKEAEIQNEVEDEEEKVEEPEPKLENKKSEESPQVKEAPRNTIQTKKLEHTADDYQKIRDRFRAFDNTQVRFEDNLVSAIVDSYNNAVDDKSDWNPDLENIFFLMDFGLSGHIVDWSLGFWEKYHEIKASNPEAQIIPLFTPGVALCDPEEVEKSFGELYEAQAMLEDKCIPDDWNEGATDASLNSSPTCKPTAFFFVGFNKRNGSGSINMESPIYYDLNFPANKKTVESLFEQF